MATARPRDDYVFFVTVIGDEGSPERARSDDLLNFVLRPAAAQHDLVVKRADVAFTAGPHAPDTTPGPILNRLLDDLYSASIVVCDLTGRNPNVFYELGLAHANASKVILLIDDVSHLPFDVRDENAITVPAGDALGASQAKSLSALVSTVIQDLLDQSYVPRSAVTDFLPLEFSYPGPLRLAYKHRRSALYKREQRYLFQVEEVLDGLCRVRLALSYAVVNPTRSPIRTDPSLTPVRPCRFIRVEIGNEHVDFDDPELRSERGINVPVDVPANSELPVWLEAEVEYRFPDSDLFATYMPSLDYELRIEYPEDLMRFVAKSMLNGRAAQTRPHPGVLVYSSRGAVAEFSGIKLDWMPPLS
jgi:hypothetical protein